MVTVQTRLFGLLNMTLADGCIVMAASKNHYNYWRPVTAIRAAETDGNPNTAGDPAWTPLRPTPPDQDYPSGHSIEGGAAAEVLKQFFGTDQISLWRDAPRGVHLQRSVTGAPLVYQFLPSGDRKRVFADPRWFPLPQSGRRGDRVWPKYWRACRHSVPPAYALSYARGLPCDRAVEGFRRRTPYVWSKKYACINSPQNELFSFSSCRASKRSGGLIA
jgi:hypothetical protein